MRKFCLMTCALVLAVLLSFIVGNLSREHATVEGLGLNFTKVSVHVTIDGIDGEWPAGVSGLGATCDVLEQVDPETGAIRKRPGRVKYGDITLKRGVMGDSKVLYDWFMDVKRGSFERKSGSIVFRDPAGEEVARYGFYEGWPCKWRGVRAPNAEAAFSTEEISLVVQKVQKVR